jgi:ABC-type lipoprotein release transport system permease subunit
MSCWRHAPLTRARTLALFLSFAAVALFLVALVLLLAALISCVIPANRAASVLPMEALRAE